MTGMMKHDCEKFMETEQEEKEGKGRDGMKKKLKGKCRNMNILG